MGQSILNPTGVNTVNFRKAADDKKKGQSQLHFQTMRDVSEGASDSRIADSDWKALILKAWDTAPTSFILEAELLGIKRKMLEPFEDAKDEAGAADCITLYNQYIVQTCWGEPGYCRKPIKKRKRRAA